MFEGNCSLEEFHQRLCERSAACQGNASSDSRTLSERESIDIECSCAEKLAHELNLWLPFKEMDSLGVPMPSGVENTVYYNRNEDVVYKVNNLMTSHSISKLLERLTIHNSVFPQTAYQLRAFTGFGHGSIYPVLKQQYIPNATYATHGEILDYMESLGFTSMENGVFRNSTLQISDLRPRNVLKVESGNLYVIDADFLLL